MNRLDLIMRTRSLVRDLSNSFFREQDVINYLNEGIDRLAQLIPEFREMSYLTTPTQEVTYLPREWQHILSLYSASRLCTQDERHYQASNFMNEFEAKVDSLKALIDSNELLIKDMNGDVVMSDFSSSYVVDDYFIKRINDEDEEW